MLNQLQYLFATPKFHPLFGAMLFLLVGIWLQRTMYPFYIAPAITVGAALLFFVCWHYYRHLFSRSIIKGVAYCSIGLLLGSWRMHQQLQSFGTFPVFGTKQRVTVVGTVIDHTAVEHQLIKDSIILRAHSLTLSSNNQLTLNCTIKLYLGRTSQVCVGDTICINNVCPRQPLNNDFSWYLMKEGIAATAFLPSLSYTVLEHPPYSLVRMAVNLKERIHNSLRTKMDASTAALYSSLFLGNRSLGKEHLDIVADEFKVWGISHYLARSGLHMVIFACIWSALLAQLPLGIMTRNIALFILSIMYAILSWSSISFIRALCAFLLYKSYSLLSIPAHTVHIFTLVCFFVLLTNPAQLFFLDFQLSFSLTFGIAWFHHAYMNSIRPRSNRTYSADH